MKKRKTRAEKIVQSAKRLEKHNLLLGERNRELKRENDRLLSGIGVDELNRAMDSTLITIAKVYGDAVYEDGDKGDIIGYRMEIPVPDVKSLDTYTVKAEKFDGKDGKPMMRIGVILK